MAQNCYHRKGRISRENVDDQNERLTTRHIETLSFLQEIVAENKELKAQNEELQKKTANCDELHALAASSRDKIKEIQDQYLQRADEINQMLLEKHKAELMRVVQEKIEAEKSWSKEQKMLKDEVARLTSTNARLQEQLVTLKENEGKAQIYELKLDAVTEENEHLVQETEKYKVVSENLLVELKRLQQVEMDNEHLMQEVKDLEQKNREMQFKVERLERDVNEAGDARENAQLVEILKTKLSKVLKEKRALSNFGELSGKAAEELKSQVEGLLEQVQLLEREKHKMFAEIELLKQQLFVQRRPSTNIDREKQNFKDFVILKRELNILKEENDDLKSRLKVKSSGMLPVLVDRAAPAVTGVISKEKKKTQLLSIKQS